MARRPLIAGNWKMNGLNAPEAQIDAIAATFEAANPDAPALLICPPATMISRLAGRGVRIGGQDCHASPSGAHTGDVSAEMLAAEGATHVIVGHSERRADHGEADADVAAKAKAAWRADLTAIICVGETEAQRDDGEALDVVRAQVAISVPDQATSTNAVIAYEPVWAIGTGKVPELADIAEMHAAIRAELSDRFGDAAAQKMRILYGGSMKPGNAADILALENVDGGLVGGASLRADDFIAIAHAAG